MSNRDENIIKLYQTTDITVKEIAEQFKVSVGTVHRIIRINNIPKRGNARQKAFSKEQEQEILKKYNEGASMLSLQKEYQTSWETLKNLFEEKGIKKNSLSKIQNPNLLEDYFENIDSVDKAYWIGWLLSDGCIQNRQDKKGYEISLTLLAQDEHILHQLEEDLQVQGKVATFCNDYKRFSLGCKKMVEDLEKYSLINNKTFTCYISNLIPKKYYSHLLRGIFDGDGGITIYKRSNGQINYELSFCGNEQIITKIKEILLEEIPQLKDKTIEQESSIKRIRWGSLKDIILIRDFLYKDCDNKHRLKRKYDKLFTLIY